MAVCAMAIALLGVAKSFAVAIYYGATAQREYPPVVSPETFTCLSSAVTSLRVPELDDGATRMRHLCARVRAMPRPPRD